MARSSLDELLSFSGTPPPGAFGTRVAPVTPWDRNAAVVRAAPLQPQAGGIAWQNAIDMMGGGVSTGTQNYIRDRAAALGVNLGAGGADWTTNNALIGEIGTSEDRVKSGLAAYNALLSGTQNLVNDTTETEMWNNTNAAAPDPAAAAQYQKQLFDEQIKLLSQAYRSPAGGTGAYGRTGAGSGPQWASVASPPNLAAPGFARAAAQPGLLNSNTYTNGIYTGGGGDTRTFAPQQPVLQPNQINYRAGGGTGYNSLAEPTYLGGTDSPPSSGFGDWDMSGYTSGGAQFPTDHYDQYNALFEDFWYPPE